MRPPHSPLSCAGLALVALATLALPLSAQPPLTPPASQPTAPPATLPEVIVEGENTQSSNTPAPPIDAPFINQPYADAPAVYDPNALFSPGASVGYAAPDSVTGTKLAISPLDFPGSVQTITESLIHDQAARNIYDLTRNVSSVGPSIGGSANRTDDLLIRGFRVQGNSDDFRKNGFRDSSRTQRDLANIDRIEILKGPAAALYGSSGEPAGLVNFITKQPLDYRQDVVSARIGYWDDYRLTLDSTGPLTNEDVTYRLNVAAQDSGSFRDFVFNERYFVAPVVRLRLAEDTYLTFEGEYLRDRRVPDRGIVLFQGSFDAIPIDRFFGEPTDQANFQDGQVSAILNHAFTEDLLLRTGYVSNWSDEYRDQVDTRRLGGGGGGGGGGGAATLQRRRFIQDDKDQNHYWIGDLVATTWLADTEHQILLGSEIGVTSRDDSNLQANATNINVLNPMYGAPQPTPTSARLQTFDNWQYSVYLQDLITLNQDWKLLAGFRQSWVDSTSLDTQNSPLPMSANQAATTPRFGAVYQPFADASAYVAYSQSFQPVVGASRLGAPFGPESGEAYEIGLKYEIVRRRLWATLAAFDIFRQNVIVPDPVDPNFNTQVGEVESRGVEFDLMGQVTERWSVIANAAYLHTEITQDTQANLLGNRADNVPYFSSNIWTRYNIQQTADRTTGLALGWLYVGDRAGDIENSYDLPAYHRWDAGLYHRRGPLGLSLYAENLFDAFYIASARNAERNMPGAPFNLRGVVDLIY